MKRLSLVIVCILVYLTITVQAEEKYAEAVLGTEATLNNIYTIAMGESTTINYQERSGRGGWLLDAEAENNSNRIDFGLLNSFAYKVSDGSEFDVEIDYYADADGYFRFYYDSKELETKAGYTEYFSNDKTWKTASFTIDDAYFGDRLDSKYDFRIAITAQRSVNSSQSAGSVVIGAVRLTRRVAANKITATAYTDESGNVFEWFSDKKIIHNTLTNVSGDEVEATVELYAVNRDTSKELFREKNVITMAADEVRNIDLDFSDKKWCSLYDYYVDITCADEVHTKKLTEFAIVKTDADGVKNDSVYYTTQLQSNTGQMDAGLDVIAKSNAGGIRSSATWWALERQEGVYNPSDIRCDVKSLVEKLPQYELGYLPVIHTMSFVYDNSHLTLPYTETQIKAWRSYVSWFADLTKNVADSYEIWNEVNHPGANPNLNNDNGNAAAYVKNVLKTAYEEIKTVDKEKKVAALALSGSGGVTYEFFEEAMDAGLSQYADIVSVHPYEGRAVELGETVYSLKKYNNKFDQSNEKLKLWNTELGYSTSDNTVNNDRTLGIFTVRQFLNYMAEDIAEKNILYCFEQNGTVKTDREDCFGIVGTMYEDSYEYGTPFLPKRGYVNMTALNYLTADSEGRGKITYDDGLCIVKLWSNKFNQYLYCVYSIYDKNINAKIRVDAENATIFDEFGNEKEIDVYGGVVYLDVNGAPTYLLGDFAECERVVLEYQQISGKINGGEKSEVSLTVLPNDTAFDESMLKRIEYINQTTTDEEGNFLFKVQVESNNRTAYIVSEKTGETIAVNLFGVTKDVEIVVYSGINEIGENISDFTPDDTSVKVTNAGDCTLYYCLYNDGTLVNCEMVEKAYSDMTYDVSLAQDFEYDCVKIMVFDSIRGMRPICTAKVID